MDCCPKAVPELAETRCLAGPCTEQGYLPSPTFLLSFWLQIQPTQRCWSFEAQRTCNNWALYCLQESGSWGLAAGWRCVAGQLPVSFALFQLSEFSLVFMASIAVVQTIYIALHLSYGQDWNKDETLSKHRHYFVQKNPALSELKIPQMIVSLCDADQHSKMVTYTHTNTDTQMQITKNRN